MREARSENQSRTPRASPGGESARRKRRREREICDIAAVLSTREGRRFVWRILALGRVFGSVFNPNALTMALLEGKRNLGLEILDDVLQADPDALARLRKEDQAQRIEDESREG